MPKLDWVCPLCNSLLTLTPYPKGRGFRLDCKGTDTIPHRLRIYLDGFRKDSPFLVGPKVSPVVSNNRAGALLSRVRGLVEKGEKNSDGQNGKEVAA